MLFYMFMGQEIIETSRKGAVVMISAVEKALAIFFFGLPIVGEMLIQQMQHDQDAAMEDEGGGGHGGH